MGSVVSERFVSCLKQLKENKHVRSYRQFAQSLDYLPQSLNEIIHGNRDVTIELCRKAMDVYDINPNFLFKGIGHPFGNESNIGDSNTLLTVVTNNEGVEKITYVPVAAQAGYGGNLHDAVYMQDLESFSLPGHQFKVGTHRCFDISGDSMEPSVQHGDKVVCSFIEQEHWDHAIKDNHVYVVITENEVVIKRLCNQIKEDGTIKLISDNRSYEPYEIAINEVKEIWCVKSKISTFLPLTSQVRKEVQEEIAEMRQSVKEQSKMIQSLNLTIEALLKQTRSQR